MATAPLDRIGPRFVLGICITLAGGLLLLDRLQLLLAASHLTPFWGLALAARILLDIVGWCLTVALAPFALAALWPLALMVWGGAMAWRALSGNARPASCGRENSHAN